MVHPCSHWYLRPGYAKHFHAMGKFAITVTVTSVLFLIIGVHTETRRVLRAMLAAAVIFIGSGVALPSVVSILIPGGPARDSQGNLMKDSRGEMVYSQTYVRGYRNVYDELSCVLYLSGSIFTAGCILLLYRAFKP